jgi:hypothetical protein
MGGMSERYTVLVKPGATDQPGIVELLTADDTSLVGDRITTVNTPTLRVALPTGVLLGDQVKIYSSTSSTTVLFSVSVTQEQIDRRQINIKIPTTIPLPDGVYTFTATIVDAAGNESQKSLIPYAVVIDTQGPAIPGGFTITAASDSGLSNSDKITRQNTSLTLTGTIAADTVAVNIYDTVSDPTQRELFDSEQFIASGVIGLGVISHDLHGVKITAATLDGLGIGGATDAAVAAKAGTSDRWLFAMYDIEANVTRMVEVLLRQAATGEVQALVVGAADRYGDHTFDAGLINTAWAKPDAVGSIAGSAAAAGYGLSRIEGSITGSKTVLLGTLSGPDLAKTTFGFTTSATDPLEVGLHNFSARAVDAAGNEGEAANIRVMIDSVSDKPSLRLSAGLDTGTSSRDGLTKQLTYYSFDGTAEPGVRVVLYRDGNPIGSVNAGEEIAETTANATTGAFQFQYVMLGAGTNTMRVMAFD